MSLVKTPVSILQELLQKYSQIPQYTLVLSDGLGTHNPLFQFRVDAGQVIGYGKARSKKEAKHEAAKDALAKFTEIGLYIPDQTTTPPMQQTSPVKQEPETTLFQINAVGMLKDFVAEHKLPPPEFTEISDVGPAHQRLFTLQCTVGTLKKTATEYTKKKAKQACAQLMFSCLLESLPDVTDGVGDDTDFLCIDDGPAVDDIFQEFSDKSVIFNKKKENYKLVVSDYPRTFNKLMTEKNLTFEELWRNVKTVDDKNLETILNHFDIKYSIDTFDNEENVLVVLTIDAEPNFCMAKIAESTQVALPYLIGEAFDFLKLMTKP